MHTIHGLDPMLFYGAIGTAGGGIRLLLRGNGSLSKAIGAVLASIILGALFGTITLLYVKQKESWAYVAEQLGIAAALIVALIAVPFVDALMETGTKCLKPVSEAAARRAEWLAKFIGPPRNENPPPAPPVSLPSPPSSPKVP